MSTHEFTQAQLDLHTAVCEAYKNPNKEVLKKKPRERTTRRAYSPENDVQLLQILAEDNRIDKFSLLNTDERKTMCQELCRLLKERFGEERSVDSVHYRVTQKLLKCESLTDINYRGETEKSNRKAKATTKAEAEKPQELVTDSSDDDFDDDSDFSEA